MPLGQSWLWSSCTALLTTAVFDLTPTAEETAEASCTQLEAIKMDRSKDSILREKARSDHLFPTARI